MSEGLLKKRVLSNLREFPYADSDDIINPKDYSLEELDGFAVYFDDLTEWFDEAKKDLLDRTQLFKSVDEGDYYLIPKTKFVKWFGDVQQTP